MASIFISASEPWKARYFADYLTNRGHKILSTWHNERTERSNGRPDEVKQHNADNDYEIIRTEADYLLFFDDYGMTPGGKFVDVGVAIGSGVTVLLIGRRENNRMYSSSVVPVDGLLGLTEFLDVHGQCSR